MLILIFVLIWLWVCVDACIYIDPNIFLEGGIDNNIIAENFNQEIINIDLQWTEEDKKWYRLVKKFRKLDDAEFLNKYISFFEKYGEKNANKIVEKIQQTELKYLRIFKNKY